MNKPYWKYYYDSTMVLCGPCRDSYTNSEPTALYVWELIIKITPELFPDQARANFFSVVYLAIIVESLHLQSTYSYSCPPPPLNGGGGGGRAIPKMA